MSNEKSEAKEPDDASINPMAAIDQQRQRVREAMAAADKLVQDSVATAQKALNAMSEGKPDEQVSAAVQRALQATENAVKQAERSIDAQIKQTEKGIATTLQWAAKAQAAGQISATEAAERAMQQAEAAQAQAHAQPQGATPAAGSN